MPLLSRVEIVPDPGLVASGDFTYPAIVEVTLRDGRVLSEQVSDTPGSPLDPWGEAEVGAKLLRTASGRISSATATRLVAAIGGLESAPSLKELTTALSEPGGDERGV
jgi:hypothetical protein